MILKKELIAAQKDNNSLTFMEQNVRNLADPFTGPCLRPAEPSLPFVHFKNKNFPRLN
jgi:hypothetical protein